MKTNRLAIIAVAATAVVVSCTSAPTSQNDEAAKKDSIEVVENIAKADFLGTYEGTLPAADCEGIKTTLTLSEDSTYCLVREFLGTQEPTAETNGVYHLIGQDLVELVTPSSGVKTYYKVIESGVALSDSLGTLNEGELAEYYKLKRK